MLTYLKQLAGETVIYGIANILSKSIAILLLPIYAAEFSPGEFGRISIITTTVSIFTILAVMGLDNSAHRWFWDSEDESFRKRVISSWFWSQLIIAIVLGLVLFAFSSLYLDIVLKNAVSTDVIFIALLCIPLTTFSKILTGWLRMQRRPLPTILFALLFTSTNLVMAIILVKYLKLGLVGVFAAQVVGAAMGGIFSVLLLKDWINPKHFSFTILKPMLIYGMPLVPGGIALWISASSDRYFLQFLSTPEELGLYSFGAMIAAVVGIVVSAFQMAWGPFAISIHTDEHANQIYAKVLSIYMVLAGGLATVITLISPYVIRFMAPDSYAGSISVIWYLSFSVVGGGAYYIAAIGANIVKKSAPVAKAVIYGAMLNLVFNYLLIPYYGKEGAAIATLASSWLTTAWLFYFAHKLHPIPYRFSDVFVVLSTSFIVVSLF